MTVVGCYSQITGHRWGATHKLQDIIGVLLTNNRTVLSVTHKEQDSVGVLLIKNRTVVGYYSQITGQCWGVTHKEQDSGGVLLTR